MTPLSIAVLQVVTAFGATVTVAVLGLLTAVYALWRWRSRSIPLFLAIVIGGQLVLADLIKGAVQRTRPDLRPLAGFTGPSFPSGHTTAAAATFIAIALVLGRDGSSRRRMLLAGVAVALAVAVACSRVFLGVHWLTDVIGGLLLAQVQALSSLYISPVWGDPLVFGMMVLVLFFRPQGLLGVD